VRAVTVRIIRSARKSISIQFSPAGVTVRAPRMASDREIKSILKEKESWIESALEKLRTAAAIREASPPLSDDELRELYRRASEAIPERTAEIAGCMGVQYGRISIRCQKTRWGSCSAQKNLNFNCLLMLAPAEVLDAVIAHELCHLTYMNHSRVFYRLLRKICPEYDRQTAWLKKNGPALLGRAAR